MWQQDVYATPVPDCLKTVPTSDRLPQQLMGEAHSNSKENKENKEKNQMEQNRDQMPRTNEEMTNPRRTEETSHTRSDTDQKNQTQMKEVTVNNLDMPGVDRPDRLKMRYSQWKNMRMVKPSKEVLGWIRNGVNLTLPEDIANHHWYPAPAHQEQEIQEILQQYSDVGIVRNAKRPQHRTTCLGQFATPKKGGDWRLVVDWRHLNKIMKEETVPTKFPTLQDIRSLIQKEWWMASIDLKDAYNHLRWSDSVQDRIWTQTPSGEEYCWKGLGFGCKLAPRVFQLTLRAALAPLQREGIIAVNYLDDIFVTAESAEECRVKTQIIVNHLTQLGFLISEKKSQLQPTQVLEYLGMIWNTREMTMVIGQRKRDAIRKQIQQIVRKKNGQVRAMASLVGKLIAAVPALGEHMKSTLKPIYTWIQKYQASRGWNGRAPLNNTVKRILRKIREMIPKWNGNPIHLQHPKLIITCDASETGWGAWSNQGHTAWGYWRKDQQEKHITYLETLCATMALSMWTQDLFKETVLVRTDNTCAQHYLKGMKGGRRPQINKLVTNLGKQLKRKEIHVTTTHIPGLVNTRADWMSRKGKDVADWTLHHHILQGIQKRLGFYPTLDGCATARNCRFNKFISRWDQPGAFLTDFFNLDQISLGIELLYINPPWSIIARILHHLRLHRLRALIVLPMWTTKEWWPNFLQMATSKILLLPQTSLYTDSSNVSHPHPRWRSVSAVVSGNLTTTITSKSERQWIDWENQPCNPMDLESYI